MQIIYEKIYLWKNQHILRFWMCHSKFCSGWSEREDRRGLQTGQVWYLVSIAWWRQWIDYVMGRVSLLQERCKVKPVIVWRLVLVKGSKMDKNTTLKVLKCIFLGGKLEVGGRIRDHVKHVTMHVLHNIIKNVTFCFLMWQEEWYTHSEIDILTRTSFFQPTSQYLPDGSLVNGKRDKSHSRTGSLCRNLGRKSSIGTS